jgi:hypothetical protein
MNLTTTTKQKHNRDR